MRIIIAGFGTVGRAFAKIVILSNKMLLEKFGLRPKIVGIIDSSGAILNPEGLDLEKVMNLKKKGSISLDINLGKPNMTLTEAIESVDSDLVIEVTQTNIINGEPGLSNIKSALKAGKHVITTNKGPLAIALPGLMELASFNGVSIRFSGAVGGGTPILDIGKNCLEGDRIISISGILNGTTNYILSKMDENNISMDEALIEAIKSGYAEKDPAYDLDGIDTACKLVIITNWLLNKPVTLKDVDTKGIRNISLEEIKKASEKGNSIKLIASVDDEWLKVRPQIISKNDPLCVNETFNSVKFTTEYAGEITVIGKGAGGIETAGAILRDTIEIRRIFRIRD